MALSSTLMAIGDRIYENNNEMEDGDIKQLYKMYNNVFLHALELVEKNCIEKLSIENAQRFYFRVEDGKSIHTLYPYVNFCDCSSYKSNLDKKMDTIICKHVLACMLSIALNNIKERTVPEMVYNFTD